VADEQVIDAPVVPEQVRRQAARAEELQRELAGERVETRGDEARLPTEAVPPRGDDADAGFVAEPAATPPPEPVVRSQTDWEQRYRTLQGKYDTEIAGLRAQVAGMERLLATMQHPPPEITPPAQLAPRGFDQGDIDLYGEDFLQAAARAAAAHYEPVIARLEDTIRRLEGGQNNLQSQTTRDRVFDALDKDPELTGWQQINTSPEFMNWLQGIDEYAGVPRNQMLQHAYSNGDAIRTGRFFKKYMAEHTVPRTPTTGSQTGQRLRPPPGGNGHAASAGTRLEDLVVPGRAAGGSGGSDGAPQPRIWSRPEISRFYRDRTEGRYRGREQESELLERDILAAASEGRVLA
jgi:hypothetical protein